VKKIIIAVILALALTAVVLPVAAFAETGSVDCTVTVGTIGVTVSDGDVDYGTLPLNTVKNTAKYDADYNTDGMSTPQTQTITTSGGVAVDVSIQSSDASGSSVAWTLAGTTGDNQFTHAYYVSDSAYAGGITGVPTFTQWSAADTDVEVASNVTDVTKYLELQLGMPITADDMGEHTIGVTVTVEQHEG
jgi:hypothetical protein